MEHHNAARLRQFGHHAHSEGKNNLLLEGGGFEKDHCKLRSKPYGTARLEELQRGSLLHAVKKEGKNVINLNNY